jgi:serine/threonine protein kinase
MAARELNEPYIPSNMAPEDVGLSLDRRYCLYDGKFPRGTAGTIHVLGMYSKEKNDYVPTDYVAKSYRLSRDKTDRAKKELTYYHMMGNLYVLNMTFNGYGNCLLMPRAAGDLMDARMDLESGFSRSCTEEKLVCFMGLLKDVAALHKDGVVHRDIKPENVFVYLEAGAQTLRLGDLESATERGTVVKGAGTAEYLPPEKYTRTGQHVDIPAAKAEFRDDIHALLVTFMIVFSPQFSPSAAFKERHPGKKKAYFEGDPAGSILLSSTDRVADFKINMKTAPAQLVAVYLALAAMSKKPPLSVNTDTYDKAIDVCSLFRAYKGATGTSQCVPVAVCAASAASAASAARAAGVASRDGRGAGGAAAAASSEGSVKGDACRPPSPSA